ncbi:MAG: NYN domain-containing protein [Bacillaceae bacterium]|nr:NYN domain-containing protein [Bacillaceae bacterium]
MENRTAIFIDGGYLDSILLTKGRARIDYEKLITTMREDIPLIRAYYYHCLPYQSSKSTKEESDQFAQAQRFFRRLNRLDSFTVRLGKLAFRGIDDEGIPIYEQKRVDVYLATDLVMHSTKRVISHAVLLTGDSDFIPAIEIAKSEGVHITLYYCKDDRLRPHDELIDAVDNRRKITQDLIETWKR